MSRTIKQFVLFIYLFICYNLWHTIEKEKLQEAKE